MRLTPSTPDRQHLPLPPAPLDTPYHAERLRLRRVPLKRSIVQRGLHIIHNLEGPMQGPSHAQQIT